MNGTFVDPITKNVTNNFIYKNVCAWIILESFLLFCYFAKSLITASRSALKMLNVE